MATDKPDCRSLERAKMYVSQGRYDEAISILLPLAEGGNSEAQYQLGELYFTGANISPEIAFNWIRRASDQDHPEACYRLACSFGGTANKCGRTVSPSLLIRAAELGSVSAAFALGVYYATGDWNGPRDTIEGAKWYERAAEHGHADAQYNLAFMLLIGEGSNQSPSAAEEWLQKAAHLGHKDAQRLLSELYHSGCYGFRKDEQLASFWLARAGSSGDHEGSSN